MFKPYIFLGAVVMSEGRKKKKVAPVKAEKPVDVILKELVGIAKENFLEKWRRWIEELILTYNLEDPKEIGYDPDTIEDFLKRWCSGLVESECLDRIRTLIIEHGGRRLASEIANAMYDYYEYMKKDPRSLCMELSLDTETCDEILRIRENPCLDRDRAYKILKAFMVRWGVPEEVADEEARRISTEIIPEVKCLPWDQVVRTAQSMLREERISRYRTLEEFFKRAPKPKPKPTPKPKPPEIEALEKIYKRVKEIKKDIEKLYSESDVDGLKEVIEEINDLLKEINKISNKCVLARETVCYARASQIATELVSIKRKAESYIKALQPRIEIKGHLLRIPRTKFSRYRFYTYQIPTFDYETIARAVILNYEARGKKVVIAREIKAEDLIGLKLYFSYRYSPRVCFAETDTYVRFLGCDVPVIAALETDDTVLLKYFPSITSLEVFMRGAGRKK